jgi:hypothetical protein
MLLMEKAVAQCRVTMSDLNNIAAPLSCHPFFMYHLTPPGNQPTCRRAGLGVREDRVDHGSSGFGTSITEMFVIRSASARLNPNERYFWIR